MTYFDPERTPVLPERRRRPARLQLEQLVRQSGRRPRRPRRPVVAVGAAIVLVATGAAAFAVAASRPVTNRTYVRCYTVADASGPDYTTVSVADRPGSAAQVHDAVSLCRTMFRQGHLRLGVRGVDLTPSHRARYRVPALVACTMRDGTAAVFPGNRATCKRLDLPAAGRSARSG